MIDKKKLIEELINNIDGCTRKDLIDIIQNFPEEPEIDFDQLRNDFGKKKCNEADCHLPNCNKIECYTNFLKSKHLSAPKPKQLPVKKTGVLKSPDEILKGSCSISFVDGSALRDDAIGIGKRFELNLPEYCYKDITETPDYSQVKVGDVVEIHHSLSKSPNYGIVQKNSNNMLSIVGKIDNINAFCIHYSQIKSLTILKVAE